MQSAQFYLVELIPERFIALKDAFLHGDVSVLFNAGHFYRGELPTVAWPVLNRLGLSVKSGDLLKSKAPLLTNLNIEMEFRCWPCCVLCRTVICHDELLPPAWIYADRTIRKLAKNRLAKRRSSQGRS